MTGGEGGGCCDCVNKLEGRWNSEVSNKAGDSTISETIELYEDEEEEVEGEVREKGYGEDELSISSVFLCAGCLAYRHSAIFC